MMMNELSVTRKADRKVMAQELEELLNRLGVNYKRIEGSTIGQGTRSIRIDVMAPRGLNVSVDLNGKSHQPNVFVLSWHMEASSRTRLNSDTFGGSVNPHHLQKATYTANGFAQLCERLEAGLSKTIDGTAFLPAIGAVSQMVLEDGKVYQDGWGNEHTVMGPTADYPEWVWTLDGNWYERATGTHIRYGIVRDKDGRDIGGKHYPLPVDNPYGLKKEVGSVKLLLIPGQRPQLAF